jgi:uncharacterized protein (DUF608 family)
MALATPEGGFAGYREQWVGGGLWAGKILDFWDDFAGDGKLDPPAAPQSQDMPFASLAVRKTIPARGTGTFVFLLTWRFPNRRTWTPKKGVPDAEGEIVGNEYCARFADAWEAARAVHARLASLEEGTVRFVRAFTEGDFPKEMAEAALFNLSTLRSQTCFRTPDGRFYGWEGVDDGAGSCFGSCTHVWNYEQATAFLFGDLARTMREVEFAHATHDDGFMSFRVCLPLERSREFPIGAADGQMGCLIKLYREWQLSGDDAFLRALWPGARRALEFCWIENGWDGDRDGVMEGCQHNTMDVEYYGPNPQMTGWYLGALRAAEEMARHLGEAAFADECQRLFESGSRKMDAELFNGAYYEHHVRFPERAEDIPPRLVAKLGYDGPFTTDYQLGAGCLVDQMVGQFAAHVCGLGYLHDPAKVRMALVAVFARNRKVGFHGHFNPMRSFAAGGEAGLLMASYPPGRRPHRPFPYFGEVMTGFEYAAAAGMLFEGLEEEGLQCIRDIRERHDGLRRNPFDEAECGHHYARAMASWGALLAWTGFRYSAVEETLRLGLRPGTFFWSNGAAWGTYTLDRDGALTLRVDHGEMRVRRVGLGDGAPIELEHDRTILAGVNLQISKGSMTTINKRPELYGSFLYSSPSSLSLHPSESRSQLRRI